MATACIECGVAHLPGAPHELNAWQYTVTYLTKHDRLPTWADSVAHCSDVVRTKHEAARQARIEEQREHHARLTGAGYY